VRANCAAFSAYVPDGRMVMPAKAAGGSSGSGVGGGDDAAAGAEQLPPVVLAWANPELVMHMDEFFASLESGAWERATLLALRALLERAGGAAGDFSYIDFGAWIGPTVLFAANFAPRVLALEPHPRPAGILAANLALPANAQLAARTRLFRECIAREAGAQTLVGDGSDSSRNRLVASGAPAAGQSFEVSCRTLPQFAREEGARNLRLVKMDVEGAELLIFPSLAPWLRALDAASLEAEFSGSDGAVSGKPSFVLSVHAPFWDASTEQQLVALWEAIALFKFVYEVGGDGVRDRSAGFAAGVTVADQLHAVRLMENFTVLILTDEALSPL
jgi:FkbM family methyltransferase